MNQQTVLIVDFGSQYTQLIARRIRELRVFREIYPFQRYREVVAKLRPAAIVLSGGPASVTDVGAPLVPEVYEANVPILGICYGLQHTAHVLGGKVAPAKVREYGRAHVEPIRPSPLFEGLSGALEVWMSHGDRLDALPPGFEVIAKSAASPMAAIAHHSRPIYGVQFHPEVSHTPRGDELLANFLFRVAKLEPTWTVRAFVDEAVTKIQQQVGKDGVVLGLSGGVDSCVAAALIHKAIGAQLHCILVDNGLLRKDEAARVDRLFSDAYRIPLEIVHAEQRFVQGLAGVTDPEKKRKLIGETFVRAFEESAKKLPDVRWLAQGTLYPDVIESAAVGQAAVIKSHHNVGGLPERMELKLLEPLRELFKDEVRALGLELGLPESLVWRHPFPGPGLAVRIVGEITEERLRILRDADEIVEEEVRIAGLYGELWQCFAVLLPVRSVGVMGDSRTYAYTICVRAVHSRDGMTADWARLPYEVLGKMSSRVIAEVQGVNRVVYDISSKPPATIEWE